TARGTRTSPGSRWTPNRTPSSPASAWTGTCTRTSAPSGRGRRAASPTWSCRATSRASRSASPRTETRATPAPTPSPPTPRSRAAGRPGGDRHVLVLDRDNWMLYEMIGAYPDGKGWKADSGAIFDLKVNKFRPAGWTSANAAGLPILPGLVRYDEVIEQKAIRHALAFTCLRTRRAYVHPARHFASKSRDPRLPPMGMRVRLRADYDVSRFPACVQVILTALKKYGMLLAQNGSNWFMNGAPDPRWNDRELSTIKRVKGRDLEVVRMGPLTTG